MKKVRCGCEVSVNQPAVFLILIFSGVPSVPDQPVPAHIENICLKSQFT